MNQTENAPPSSPTRGILYVAYGEHFLRQAEVSARSVRRHMPEIPIAVYTDCPTEEPSFTQIHTQPKPRGTGAKILHIRESPFEHTLFLDTDTFVCDDVSELFELLSRFDVAAANSHIRYLNGFPGELYSRMEPELIDEAPECFPEVNSGVLLFRQSSETNALFQTWDQLHEQWFERYQIKYDQPALRTALFRHREVNLYILAAEYNWRALYVNFAYERVKIIHVHDFLISSPLEKLAQRINASKGPRIYIPNWGVIRKPSRGLFRIVNDLRNKRMVRRIRTGKRKHG